MTGPPDILSLVRQALDEFETVPLAASARRAVRIARLRDDLVALWWLSLEQGPFDHRREIRAELAPHFSAEDFKKLHETVVEWWIRERTVRNFDVDGATDEELVDASSVAGLEEKADHFARIEQDERALGNLAMAEWTHSMRTQTDHGSRRDSSTRAQLPVPYRGPGPCGSASRRA